MTHFTAAVTTSVAAPLVFAVALAAALSAPVAGQAARDTRDAHVAKAKTAAGGDFTYLFTRTCGALTPPPPAPAQPTTAPAGPPARALWHADPAKVFDNLYFVGQTEYSAWAITTSAGIIVIDAIFDYSVEDEVVNGLRTLGLDPAQIKYVIVSHAHSDHVGGAKLLQDRFGARILLSAADWELLATDPSSMPKPRHDMVATDGQTLTLGDTTVTMYLTPGHTLGTISTLIPVKDGGRPHLAAAWGGTAFNWITGPARYITAERQPAFWFDVYSKSASRFRDIVAKAGADVLIANHTEFDGSKKKIPALKSRRAGDPHPYVIGNDSVQRYLTVAEECAKAGLSH